MLDHGGIFYQLIYGQKKIYVQYMLDHGGIFSQLIYGQKTLLKRVPGLFQ